MTLFLRDVGNFFVHFIFMFVVFSTGLGIVLMLELGGRLEPTGLLDAR